MSNTVVLDAVRHRRELAGYCERILGSAFEADDAVQETMVRAWTRQETFEGRSSVRSWLYRIATNVCLDMLRGRGRRAVPVDVDGPDLFPDGRHPVVDHDPADVAAVREAVEDALVVLLQRLPARQRAVLVLRDVLAWSAPEVAELLGTTVASVNSALQRARATLAGGAAEPAPSPQRVDGGHRPLLARYVTAFEHSDIAALVALVRQDHASGQPAA